MAEQNELFNVENDVIITTKDEITAWDVFDYINLNLFKFRIGTMFLIVCGVHTSEDGKLGEADLDLVDQYHAMFDWFASGTTNEELEIVEKVKERKFNMGTILQIDSKMDEQENHVLCPKSKASLKLNFENILSIQLPIVLILASCWSHKSEISQILRAAGLYSALNITEERGKIMAGKMFKLDLDQQRFLRMVTYDFEKKDIIVGGHFGSGKTIMGIEAAKIKTAKFLEENETNVKVFALTFDKGDLDYKLLNEELKSKGFQDENNNLVTISHWSEFLATFMTEYEKILSPRQKNLLSKPSMDYEDDDDDNLKLIEILMIVASILDQLGKKIIILIDEFDINSSCQNFLDGKWYFEVDFRFLKQYKNIHFIFCFRPCGYGQDFEFILPEDQHDGQLYMIFSYRHRSSKQILEFVRYWQNKFAGGFLCIEKEICLDDEALPPLVDNLNYGVLWIPMTNYEKENAIIAIISEIFTDIKETSSVAILFEKDGEAMSGGSEMEEYFRELNKDCPLPYEEYLSDWKGGECRGSQVAEKIKDINKNEFCGPYEAYLFNGKEAEIIIYITSSESGLDIQSLTRARRLLIIITHGKFWNDESLNFKKMDEAIKKNLAKKASY